MDIMNTICLDISEIPSLTQIAIVNLKETCKKAKLEIKRDETVMLYTGRSNRNFGKPE